MRYVSRFVVFLIVLVGMTTANAANPREQLNQMVNQLRAHPTDTALREKIIELARSIKPAPTVPEEARKAFVRGNSAFADAKNTEEFERAITLYRDASTHAPWWGDVYFNLAKALEQRQHYGEAVTCLKLYLLAAPSAPDARKVQDKIYVLEEKAERTAKETNAKAQAEAAKAERRRWATEIVQWLRTNYGGRLERNSVCGAPGRSSVQCSDAEVAGNNWHQVYSQAGNDTLDLRGDNVRFSYTTTGPDADLIQIGLGFPRADTMICGAVSGPRIEYVSWSFCDKAITGQVNKLTFSRTARDNKPWVEKISSCQGDLCTRERYVLEN